MDLFAQLSPNQGFVVHSIRYVNLYVDIGFDAFELLYVYFKVLFFNAKVTSSLFFTPFSNTDRTSTTFS